MVACTSVQLGDRRDGIDLHAHIGIIKVRDADQCACRWPAMIDVTIPHRPDDGEVRLRKTADIDRHPGHVGEVSTCAVQRRLEIEKGLVELNFQ